MNINIDRVDCAYNIALHVETEIVAAYLAERFNEAEYEEAIKRLHSAEDCLMGVKGILQQAEERNAE